MKESATADSFIYNYFPWLLFGFSNSAGAVDVGCEIHHHAQEQEQYQRTCKQCVALHLQQHIIECIYQRYKPAKHICAAVLQDASEVEHQCCGCHSTEEVR